MIAPFLDESIETASRKFAAQQPTHRSAWRQPATTSSEKNLQKAFALPRGSQPKPAEI
jgi:hypothetical protein